MYNFSRPDIGKLVEKKDLKALVKALFYDNFKHDNIIKNEAAAALRRMDFDDPKLMKQLVQALLSENPNVRSTAAWAMYSLTNHGTKPPIEPLLVALEDEDGYVRAAVIRVLDSMLDERAITLLLLMYSGKILKPTNNIMECDGFLVDALRSYGRAFPDEIARQMISGIAKGQYSLSYGTLQILAETHHPDTLPILLDVALRGIEDSNASLIPLAASKLREAAVDAIGRLRDKQAIPALTKALSHPAVAISSRIRIIYALSEICDPAANGPLASLLQDESQPAEVREAARAALEKISA